MKDRHWRLVEQIAAEADMVLYVLDARLGLHAVSSEAKALVEKYEKPIIYVINKSDLVDKKVAAKLKQKLTPSVLVSVKDREGVNRIRGAIARARPKKENCTIAVIGHPNAGKSSVINILKGRSSAKASSRAGTTLGIQHIRINENTLLIDSPGIVPLNDTSSNLSILVDSKNIDQVKDPELLWNALLPMLLELYSVKEVAEALDISEEMITENDDPEVILEHIAIKQHRLIKGGQPDIVTIAKRILSKWQQGTLINKGNTHKPYNKSDYV